MTLDFWARTSGTWVNAATVLLGTTLGLWLRAHLPAPMITILTQAVGLITLFLGFSMANSLTKVNLGGLDGVVLGLLTLALGGVLGEWWQVEEKLVAVGNFLKQRFKGDNRFTEGFVAASLLFCVGPMTLLGCLNNGLLGDNRLLMLKASMDGLAAFALTSSFGVGVGFSVWVILIYQGGLSLLAGSLAPAIPDPTSAPTILLMTGVGGLMIVGIGLNLLEIGKIPVAAFLPALLLALIWGLLYSLGQKA